MWVNGSEARGFLGGCRRSTAAFGPGVEIGHRVADIAAELVEGRSRVEGPIAFERMGIEGEVSRGGFCIDETDGAGVLHKGRPREELR